LKGFIEITGGYTFEELEPICPRRDDYPRRWGHASGKWRDRF